MQNFLYGTRFWLLLAAYGLPVANAQEATKEPTFAFRVEETAGWRRFGYPVAVEIPLPESANGIAAWQLVDAKDQPIAAQIVLLKGETPTLAVDFAVSMAPREAREYRVVPKPEAKAAAKKESLRLETTGDEFKIHSGGMVYRFAKQPKPDSPLILGVTGGGDYLGEAGGRFEGVSYPAPGEVLLQGGSAIAIRYRATVAGNGKDPEPITIDLKVPRSKSWVEVKTNLTPARSKPLVFDLALAMKATPKEELLVDFGAGETVYTTLKESESALWAYSQINYRSGLVRHLLVSKGKDALFTGGNGRRERVPELKNVGWAHVMDRQRCLAAGIDMEKVWNKASMSVDGNGRFRIEVTEGAARLWFHFVPMPVQVGALTSPQAMQNPLKVTAVRLEKK